MMFLKTKEEKVMRDPVHGYIHINLRIIWDCIATKEFQRLRRIHQLGGNYQVYHTAEHSRFSHSLGVYEIVRRMVEENRYIHAAINERDKVVVMLAGLLHDIGHGPFSHAFEMISGEKHEDATVRIILGDSEIHQTLSSIDANLPIEVANVIIHQHENKLLSQMISSQLDADRMDYLLRDAYFTGTSYGTFDLERILRTLRVKDGKIVVKKSGIHSIEDYIMARHHMYWQVYFHPIARSYEGMIKVWFLRIKDLYLDHKLNLEKLKPLEALITNKVTLESHYECDEALLFYSMTYFSHHEDAILRQLSVALLTRKLFVYQDYHEQLKDTIQKQLELQGYVSKYFLFADMSNQKTYMPYTLKGEEQNIWILITDETIQELSIVSPVVSALLDATWQDDKKIFYLDTMSERSKI